MKKLVGNDIIDIEFARKQSNWKRPGYIDKVFTAEEQKYIYSSENPETIVWLLWSMKESAYKINVQQYLKQFYAPLKMECVLNNCTMNCAAGVVSIGENCYTIKSVISESIISTIATPYYSVYKKNIINEDIEFSNSDYKSQHAETYSSITKKLQMIDPNNFEQLSIIKDDFGIPRIKGSILFSDSVISISHHGRYGAFVIAI